MVDAYKFIVFKTSYLFIFREGEGKEKDRERNINGWLPLVHPLLGTWPATQACALTGNWTGDPLVRRPSSIHWATPARMRMFRPSCTAVGTPWEKSRRPPGILGVGPAHWGTTKVRQVGAEAGAETKDRCNSRQEIWTRCGRLQGTFTTPN